MPIGKPAGIRCIQLTYDDRCFIFGKEERPSVCLTLRPTQEMCRSSPAEAIQYLTWLEAATGAQT